jgi:hypothetical protein
VNKWTSCQTAQVSKRPNKRRNLLFSPFEWLNAEKARKNQQFPDTCFSPKSLKVSSPSTPIVAGNYTRTKHFCQGEKSNNFRAST